MEKLLDEAKRFFKEYRAVFDTGDMDEFSKRFAEPFVSIRADGTIQSMPTNESASEFFEHVSSLWKAEGYDSFRTRDYEVTPIGSSAMLVTLSWDMLDKDNQLIKEWRQSYNLVKQDDVWQVYASTFHIASS